MVVFCNIMKSLQLNKQFIHIFRTCHTHDRYLEYFRNIKGYKNSLMQLNNDYSYNKSIHPGMSSIMKEKEFKTNEFLVHLMHREKVMKLSMEELKDTMVLMAIEKIDLEKYELVLKHVDERCASSVDRWPLDLSLYILDAWFSIMGPKIFRKHYYCALTNLLSKKMKKCSKHNLILILHFIGLSKNSPPFLMELIKHKLEKFVPQLNDEEWAAACLSFFKTSTKMDSDLLLKHCCVAAKNLMLKNDRFNLISILKCLRLSKYLDDDMMNNLTEFIKKEITTFNFVECTNFLAAYATQNIYNFEVFELLENRGISLLSEEDPVMEFSEDIGKLHPSERSRVKDIGKFLWGLAFVGHDINQKTLNVLVDLLNMRINSGEFESQLPVLIDCLQSLILFGQYPLNMIEHVLDSRSLQKILYIDKAKPRYQLYFVERSAYVENYIPEIKNKKYMKNIPKSLEKEVSSREGFHYLIDYLDLHMKENTFTCCYIMPHIMISGIFVATNPKESNSDKLTTTTLLKFIEEGIITRNIEDILQEDKVYTAIELLDPSVCVQGSNRPLGLMKTKIRQLQKLNINVITVSLEEITAFSESSENNSSKFNQIKEILF